eukprot:6381638-Pyramimonas_sp.AAC.1
MVSYNSIRHGFVRSRTARQRRSLRVASDLHAGDEEVMKASLVAMSQYDWYFNTIQYGMAVAVTAGCWLYPHAILRMLYSGVLRAPSPLLAQEDP